VEKKFRFLMLTLSLLTAAVPSELLFAAGGKGSGDFRIVPLPKTFNVTAKSAALPSGSVQLNDFAAGMFTAEMAYLGRTVDVTETAGEKFRCIWGTVDESRLEQALENVKSRTGGYILQITADGIGIASAEKQGLYYGLQSLLQLLEQSTDNKLPVCTVEDWPDFAFCGFHQALRPPKAYSLDSMEQTVEMYKWLIRRLARYKYTHLCLMTKGTLAFESYPELEMGPWTGKEVQQLLRFAADRGIAVFPEVKTMGKFFESMPVQNGMESFADLLERRKYIGQLDYQAQYHAGYGQRAAQLEEEQKALEKEQNAVAKISEDFKITDPAVFEFLRPVLDEVYDMFGQPEFFHIGCDESFYIAINEPAEERGPLMAAYINHVAEYLQAKGCKVMMWDDMLVSHEQFPYFFEAHGGPPLNTWTAVETLNKDIVLACWHYGYTVAGHYPQNYSMIGWLADKGFQVIGVPWFKEDGILNMIRNVKEANGMGMMGSAWALHQTVRCTLGTLTNNAVSGRKEMAIFAATAEAAWSPENAATVLEQYDAEAWEKRWLKKD